MTEALRVAGFALTAALAAFSLRAVHREAGAAVALAGGLMLFFFAVTKVSAVAEALRDLSRQAGVGDGTLTLLFKLVAMAYVTEFAVQACQDAGEAGLSAKAALSTNSSSKMRMKRRTSRPSDVSGSAMYSAKYSFDRTDSYRARRKASYCSQESFTRERAFWKSGSSSRTGARAFLTNLRLGFRSSSVGWNFRLASSIRVRASAVSAGMTESMKR